MKTNYSKLPTGRNLSAKAPAPQVMPTIPASHLHLRPLLRTILETKRPTKDEKFCTEWMIGLLMQSPYNNYPVVRDRNNNITLEVPVPTVPEGRATTCFTAHTDTVHKDHGKLELVTNLTGGMLSVKDGGVLGADDGAGIYIMLEMIAATVPGLYVFFASEEQGRVGSIMYDMPQHITKVVSFDRKGTDNLITHQMGEAGCSDAFADALIEQLRTPLPFVKDPTGAYTDSYSFFSTVPECVNLSVGYYNQHTKEESLNIAWLEEMVTACLNVDWEGLPVERDPRSWQDDMWGSSRMLNWGQQYDRMYVVSTTVSDEDALVVFCEYYPEVVASMLVDYGITVDDLRKYRDQFDWR